MPAPAARQRAGEHTARFRIKPKTIWPLNRTADSKSTKGYLRSQFEQAWRRYCEDDDTAAQASRVKSLTLASDGTT
jgi:hypothetical protein